MHRVMECIGSTVHGEYDTRRELLHQTSVLRVVREVFVLVAVEIAGVSLAYMRIQLMPSIRGLEWGAPLGL
jgi:hypothetical protein